MELIRDQRDSREGTGADDLTEAAQKDQGEGEAQTHADAVEQSRDRLCLQRICLGAAEDDAVDDDQRDVDAQRIIHCRGEALDQQLDDGDQRCDDDDLGGQTDSVRDQVADRGNQQVREHQNCHGGKSHADRVADGGRDSEGRAEAQRHDKDGVLGNDAVLDTIHALIHF